MDNTAPFKRCPECGSTWPDRDRLLADPAIAAVAYQAAYRQDDVGFLLFNHDCGTTLAIPIGALRDLSAAPPAHHGPHDEAAPHEALALLGLLSRWPKRHDCA